MVLTVDQERPAVAVALQVLDVGASDFHGAQGLTHAAHIETVRKLASVPKLMRRGAQQPTASFTRPKGRGFESDCLGGCLADILAREVWADVQHDAENRSSAVCVAWAAPEQLAQMTYWRILEGSRGHWGVRGGREGGDRAKTPRFDDS